jgi:hypothetical protein
VLHVTVATQVLDGVRPFLSVAGGAISVDRLEGVGGLQVLLTVLLLTVLLLTVLVLTVLQLTVLLTVVLTVYIHQYISSCC